MKKNQLFGILALMMALGMSFPATTFASHESADRASSADTSLESASESSTHETMPGESTAETGALPVQEQEDEEEDEEKDKDKNKAKNKDRDQNNARKDGDNGSNDISTTTDDKIQPADDDINPGMVSSYADIVAILNDPAFAEVEAIRLVNDIIVDGDIQIARESPITLDLNGHSIISCGNGMVGQENARVIDIEHGQVTITGEGSIMAMGPGGVAISIKGSINESTANYASVIIDEQVRLHAPNSYGITIGQGSSAAYGVKVELRGSISAQNGIYVAGSVQSAGDNAPEIQLADTSVVNAEDTGIVAAGFANWHCGASTISSATGIKAYSGNLAFENTNVLASGEDLAGDGAGAAFLFGGEAPENVNVTIKNGVYASAKEYVFADYGSLSAIGTNLESLEIRDGHFTSLVGIFYGFDVAAEYPEDGEIVPGATIRGGNFNTDVTDFLAPGMHLEETADDRWIVVDEAALQLIEAKAELQAIVDLARAKEKIYYTAESYQKLATTIADVTQKLSQADLTFDQVDEASAKLNKALDTLKPADNLELNEIIAARQELTEAISAAQQLDPNKYDDDDYRDFMELIDEAKTLLSQERAAADDLQSMLGEIDAMREILLIFDEEQAFTTAKLALEELIDEVNSLLSEVDPSDTVYDELRTTLVEAAGLLANDAASVSSNELEDAYSHISALKEAFFPTEFSEPDQVESVIQIEDLEQSEELEQSEQFDEQSSVIEQQTLAPEPSVASEIAEAPDDDSATASVQSSDVDQTANKTLEELRHGLAEMLAAVTDLTLGDYRAEFTSQYYDLQTIISEARELLAHEATANAAAVAEIMNRILVATSGLQDANETETTYQSTAQATVQPAQLTQPSQFVQPSTPVIPSSPVQPIPAQNISAQLSISEPALDTTILGEIIAQIARLDSNKYTAASYSRILTVLERAKTVIANPASRQDDVDQIVLSLYRATADLVSVSTPTTAYSSSQVSSSHANPSSNDSSTTDAISAISSAPLSAGSGDTITPSLMMSALAGIYTGLAMYRKSRIVAKNAKLARLHRN